MNELNEITLSELKTMNDEIFTVFKKRGGDWDKETVTKIFFYVMSQL